MLRVRTAVAVVAWGAAQVCGVEECAQPVTRVMAKVVPEQVIALAAQESGEVELSKPGDGRAKAGELLARVNPEELELEAAELELQIAKEKLESENEILRLTREKEEMEFVTALPEEKRLYVAQRMEVKADERALALLEQKIELVRKRMHLNEQKLRSAFERKAALRDVRMPFDGRVQYHISAPREGKRAAVTAGTPLLTVADDSALYVAVAMQDPSLVQLEPERLSVRLAAGGEEGIQAAWHHKRVEKEGREEALIYYYKVPEEARERAWALLGANTVAEIWCRGEASWRYEPKAELAQEAGERPFESWEELVAALRPGYAIVYSGETHLALRPQQGEP